VHCLGMVSTLEERRIAGVDASGRFTVLALAQKKIVMRSFEAYMKLKGRRLPPEEVAKITQRRHGETQAPAESKNQPGELLVCNQCTTDAHCQRTSSCQWERWTLSVGNVCPKSFKPIDIHPSLHPQRPKEQSTWYGLRVTCYIKRYVLLCAPRPKEELCPRHEWRTCLQEATLFDTREVEDR